MSFPRIIAEQNFTAAAGQAALFELRVRLRAGTIPSVAEKPIDTKLSEVVDAIVVHHQAALNDREVELLKNACKLRNKVLHCELSSARQFLDPSASGGVTIIPDVSSEHAWSTIKQLINSGNAGQQAVAATKTKKHRDVFGWLLEAQGAGEFAAASSMFQEVIALLERLDEDQSQDA